MYLSEADKIFFEKAGLDLEKTQRQVKDALAGADDGELFLEYLQFESLSFDDGKLKQASFNQHQGFGLRSVADDLFGHAHGGELTNEAIGRAVKTVKAVQSGYNGVFGAAPAKTNRALYGADNPIELVPFEKKVALLAEIDAYLRAKDSRVKQVMVNLAASHQIVEIIRADERLADIRPLVRLNISVVTEENGRSETGSHGSGGRVGYDMVISPDHWRAGADEALRQALVNLTSIAAPAGEMQVVLGPGWPGILLHEAIGHGLEGDFNRKKTSAFAGLLGKQVAAKGVTVVDDGTINDRRGSLTIDDEGTPTQNTTLIEDGILVGYIQDRQNARLMGMKPTGNGRRESHAHSPMPRMTNTYMLNGHYAPDEIIRSVKNGLYAVNFGGGQVDITSGKFVFSASEAYRIENGKIGAAVKGATLIGNGPDVLTKVSMVGNDMKLDTGVGTCGKDGQSVPVGVGQPTLKIDRLTVGGTAT